LIDDNDDIDVIVHCSARPGRPPKRSAVSSTPDALDSVKKSRAMSSSIGSPDYFSPVAHIIGMCRTTPCTYDTCTLFLKIKCIIVRVR